MSARPAPRRRGLALIVIVCVLGLLTVMTACFLSLAQMERRASQRRIHQTRALLLARSGIEDAQARFRLGQDPFLPETEYEDSSIPLSKARRPSFSVGGPSPDGVQVEGRLLGYSGALGAEVPAAGAGYALRIDGGGFHVNGGDPAQSAGLGYNAVLRGMLGTLAEAIDRETTPRRGILVEADGWALIDARPADGWRGLDQIRDGALGGSQARMDLLRPYLALHAWTDRKVIRPSVLPAMEDKEFKCWGEIRQGRSNVRTDPTVAPTRDPPDFERVGTRLMGRAPVDFSWARRRKPALIALTAGLGGLYLGERSSEPVGTAFGVFAKDCVGHLRKAEIRLAWGVPNDCEELARQVFESTSEIRTWEDFDRFCDTLTFPSAMAAANTLATVTSNAWVAAGRPHPDPTWNAMVKGQDGLDVQEACRSLLKANFNPNSNLNKFNPNAAQWHLVDKSDLTAYSTEFSLQPLAAVRIRSLGRVSGPNGRLLAQQELEAELGGPFLLRLTTQGEFVAGDLGNPDLAGDESAFRSVSAPLFLGRSRGMTRTWGKDFLANPQEKGLSLQSYPEPCVGASPSMAPSAWDGNLQLATIETETDVLFGQPGGAMKILARFDNSFDLDKAGSPLSALCMADSELNCAAVNLTRSVLDKSRPNTLYPDGCYAERNREPAYLGDPNLPKRHGLLSFWVKPNYDFAKAPRLGPGARRQTRRGHLFFLATRHKFNCSVPPHHPSTMNNQPSTQQFLLGQCCGEAVGEVFGADFEINFLFPGVPSPPEDDNREHEFVVPDVPPPRVWRLISFYWDFETTGAGSHHAAGEMVLDGTRFGSNEAYGKSSQNMGLDCQDLTGAPADCYAFSERGGPHRFVLGSRFNEIERWMKFDCCGSGADATIDEFAVWDFGQDPGNTLVQNLAATRYADGRYYRGNVYTRYGAAPVDDQAPEWTSAPLRLPAGSLLDSVSWTLSPSQGYWLELELLEPDGSGYLGASEASSRSGNAGNAQTWKVDRSPGKPFRAHAVFRRDVMAPSLLDTPRLDDLSFTYTPPGGLPVLSWDPR